MRLLYVLIMFVCGFLGYSQTIDTRPVVGVAQFSCEVDATYSGLVTEKVVEMLTKTKRFRVVDRTSHDKIKAELELQKSKAFMDSKNLVEQDVAVAAEKMITGHISKLPIYRIKNAQGSTRGYKAAIHFQLKVVDVETGLSSEATSFQGKTSEEMLSPESALTASMNSLSEELFEYFRLNFPIKAKIVKLLVQKKNTVKTLLINAGQEQGIKVGDRFKVSSIEMIEGQPYPAEIGNIEVRKLSGATFCECEVPSKIGGLIFTAFSTGQKIECELIVK